MTVGAACTGIAYATEERVFTGYLGLDLQSECGERREARSS